MNKNLNLLQKLSPRKKCVPLKASLLDWHLLNKRLPTKDKNKNKNKNHLLIRLLT